MSENAKTILGVVLGIIGAILVFCLVVCIACSVNGLTFGEQICDWFSSNSDAINNSSEEIASTVASIIA